MINKLKNVKINPWSILVARVIKNAFIIVGFKWLVSIFFEINYLQSALILSAIMVLAWTYKHKIKK